jgi:hypothetical protein
VSYRHPLLRSERARGDGGCIGKGHIATGQGEESGARDNVGCDSLFFNQSPPSYSFLDGDNGGGERVSYCHPSLRSERARGNGGCIGGGHITTGQGEERGACDNVGCALFFDPSPSTYSFVDGNNGGGERVSYRHQ